MRSAAVMAEAIVIGGGVMGLASARELQRRGYSVRLLARATPGRAAWRASAGVIGAAWRERRQPSALPRARNRRPTRWGPDRDGLRGAGGYDDWAAGHRDRDRGPAPRRRPRRTGGRRVVWPDS